MKKFIPYEKLGKKAKQKLNKQKRSTWKSINPVTKIADTSKKTYKRYRRNDVVDYSW